VTVVYRHAGGKGTLILPRSVGLAAIMAEIGARLRRSVSRVFLSHSSLDSREATAVKAWLIARAGSGRGDLPGSGPAHRYSARRALEAGIAAG